MSRVDVVIPCYNYGRFLAQSVRSVLSQDGVAVRILILDDASTDDTPAVAADLAAADPRIEYRRHPANRGHIATFNEGIDWLREEYFQILSADDLLVPGALARAAAVMDRHPHVGLTHGKGFATAHPDPERDPLVVTSETTIQTGPEFIRQRCELGQNWVDIPTVIGRTAVLKQVGYFRPELPHSGDMEMWLRHAAHSSIAYLHSHQGYYRTHTTNMSIGYRGVSDIRQVKLAFDFFFDQYQDRMPEGAELRRTAYRSIGKNTFEVAYRAFARGEDGLCRECVALAHEIDPRTRYLRKWVWLKCKLLLGSRRWFRLRSLLRFRRSPVPTPAASGPGAAS